MARPIVIALKRSLSLPLPGRGRCRSYESILKARLSGGLHLITKTNGHGGAAGAGHPRGAAPRGGEERLRAVLGIADELMSCPDVDSLFRAAVELARTRLGLERCSLSQEEGAWPRGTYGTDPQGRTTDERAHHFMKASETLQRLSPLRSECPRWMVIHEPYSYWDG